MKTAAIFASATTLFALIFTPTAKVHAQTLEACFRAKATTVGKISMAPEHVNIYWDVDDFAEASREQGKVAGYKSSNGTTSGEATMNGAEGTGSLYVEITKTHVGFVELNAQKEPTAPKEFRQRVSCPAEASPLELASEDGTI